MAAENKVALITGANKGIGLEIARQLGRQGFTVLLGSRDEARGRAAADTLRGEGIDAHAVTLDVTREADMAGLPARLQEQFGRLDVLVNNAGVMQEARASRRRRSARPTRPTSSRRTF